ncbi:MAG: hypothetical protein OXJ52_10125 [Oligoflexia bacterium]|nr:hypothetical protein [Oligoflexia bacterium]
MKASFYFLSFLCFLFFCSCIYTRPPHPPIVFPDRGLEDDGWYQPRDPNYVKTAREESLGEGWVTGGDERFRRTGLRYCYNKTEKKEKPPVWNKKIRVQLLNKEGKVLEETFVRRDHFSDTDNISSISAYIPYHKEAYELNIVRLERGKEVQFSQPKIILVSRSELIRDNSPKHLPRETDYSYDEKTQCHKVHIGH